MGEPMTPAEAELQAWIADAARNPALLEQRQEHASATHVPMSKTLDEAVGKHRA
jgi:hypothetical protein